MTRRAPAALALLGFAGCFQATNTGIGVAGSQGQSCESCKSSGGGHPAGSAGGSGSGSSAGGSSSGGSASTGGSSSGGTVADAGLMQCPAGTFAGATTIEAINGLSLQGMPVAGAVVDELGENLVQLPGVGTSATSGPDGGVQLCITYGLPTTLSVSAAATPNTYLEEFVVTEGVMDAGVPAIFANGLFLVPDSALLALSAFVPAGNLQVTQACVVADIVSADPDAGLCPEESGWTFGLYLPDGGTLPDGGNAVPFTAAYFDSFGVPSLTGSVTSKSGTAILFNIDPSLTNAAILVATNPDAGACGLVQGAVRQTGRVTIENSSVTYAPLFTR